VLGKNELRQNQVSTQRFSGQWRRSGPDCSNGIEQRSGRSECWIGDGALSSSALGGLSEGAFLNEFASQFKICWKGTIQADQSGLSLDGGRDDPAISGVTVVFREAGGTYGYLPVNRNTHHAGTLQSLIEPVWQTQFELQSASPGEPGNLPTGDCADRQAVGGFDAINDSRR